jgi:hypothetical protein
MTPCAIIALPRSASPHPGGAVTTSAHDRCSPGGREKDAIALREAQLIGGGAPPYQRSTMDRMTIDVGEGKALSRPRNTFETKLKPDCMNPAKSSPV